MPSSDLPFDRAEERDMITSVAADEALDAVERTGSFVDAADDPDFKQRVGGRVSRKFVEPGHEAAVAAVLAEVEEKVRQLVSLGYPEPEARRQVRGAMLEVFTRSQLEKRAKEE